MSARVIAVVPGRCAECKTPAEHVGHVRQLLARGENIAIGFEPTDAIARNYLATLCTDEAFAQLCELNEKKLADALAKGIASSCSYCAEILLDDDPHRGVHLKECRERYLAAHTIDTTFDDTTEEVAQRVHELVPAPQAVDLICRCGAKLSTVARLGQRCPRCARELDDRIELELWKRAAETNALENAALKNHMNRAGVPFPSTPEYAYALGQVAAEQLGKNSLRWECQRGCVNWGAGTHCSSCGRARDLEADELAGNTLGWRWHARDGRSELELMLGCQFCGTHHCVNLVVQQGGEIWHQVPAGVWMQPRTGKHPHVRCSGCLAPPAEPAEEPPL